MKKINPYWVFSIVFFGICISALLYKTICYHPTGVHVWRQSDSAAYAFQYWQNKVAFWQPATMTLLGYQGRVVSEFPIIYYLSAKLYSVFGFHDYIIRVLHFMMFVGGMLAQFALCKSYIKSTALAIFPPLFWATLPYVFYYAPNFLPNIPAASSVFISMYFFKLYYDNKQMKHLLWALVFAVLGSVLKVTELLVYVALLCSCITYRLANSKLLFISKKHAPVYASAAVLIAVTFAWYGFARYYNAANHTDQNLLSILPIWGIDADYYTLIVERIQDANGWKYTLGSKLHYILVEFFIILFVIGWFKMHPFLKHFTLWVALGVVAYAGLWFEAFYHHDYYMLPLAYLPLALALVACVYFDSIITNTAHKITASVLVTLCFIYFSVHNHSIQKSRYFTNNEVVNIIKNENVYTLTPYLRSIGIQPSDYVLCSGDFSLNVELYAIQQQGWTTGYFKHLKTLQQFTDLGAKYLIVQDSSYYATPMFADVKPKQIGQYHGIGVFDLAGICDAD